MNSNKIEDSKLQGFVNGHEYVDLGLSVKWGHVMLVLPCPQIVAITMPGARPLLSANTTGITA